MLAPAIAFVDLETTGTTPTGDRVTEIGTVRVSRRLYPEAQGHSLDAIIARHRLTELVAGDAQSRTGRHSALGDARALWGFVQALYRERASDEIAAAVRRLLKTPSLPPQ